MFNSIRGIITEKHADTLFILSGNVEWDITVPTTDINRLPPVGEEGRVFTWLYHREDQMRLFGFSDAKRRNTFLELLKVEGIGPKGAIKILGGIGQEELERALENGDLGRLEAVPGLGKKTAQKMILALKGRLTSPVEAPGTSYGELAEALIGMGYDRKAAVEALGKAEAALTPDIPEAEREKQLFKQAIKYLSGGI
ncbi:MAG: Holliday junction branch migration protein RuvA [Spirochaetaceae bacterium]|jgi:Holliday junction DNA helicase RuvA|nr:Holliday junction branch migration protein RuvA [Spirochaetaceae bacterium]